MRAHQIMTRKVISVAPETTIVEAATLMLQNHISGLPVVDRGGAVVGVVSEGDFLRRSEIGTQRKRNRLLSFLLSSPSSAEDYVHDHGRKVSDVMTLLPVTVSEDTPLAELVSVMERNNIKRVPVVRDGKLVGIVAQADIAKHVSAMQTGDVVEKISK